MIPIINNPTRVTINTATTTDHFITNAVVDIQFKSGIIRTNLSDHFPIIFVIQANEKVFEKHNEQLFKRDIMTKNKQTYFSKNCIKQQGITLRM